MRIFVGGYTFTFGSYSSDKSTLVLIGERNLNEDLYGERNLYGEFNLFGEFITSGFGDKIVCS